MPFRFTSASGKQVAGIGFVSKLAHFDTDTLRFFTGYKDFDYLSPLNTTIILGNGAEFLLSPNFNLPRINLISALPYIKSWNHFVSVLAGSNITTLAP